MSHPASLQRFKASTCSPTLPTGTLPAFLRTAATASPTARRRSAFPCAFSHLHRPSTPLPQLNHRPPPSSLPTESPRPIAPQAVARPDRRRQGHAELGLLGPADLAPMRGLSDVAPRRRCDCDLVILEELDTTARRPAGQQPLQRVLLARAGVRGSSCGCSRVYSPIHGILSKECLWSPGHLPASQTRHRSALRSNEAEDNFECNPVAEPRSIWSAPLNKKLSLIAAGMMNVLCGYIATK